MPIIESPNYSLVIPGPYEIVSKQIVVDARGLLLAYCRGPALSRWEIPLRLADVAAMPEMAAALPNTNDFNAAVQTLISTRSTSVDHKLQGQYAGQVPLADAFDGLFTTRPGGPVLVSTPIQSSLTYPALAMAGLTHVTQSASGQDLHVRFSDTSTEANIDWLRASWLMTVGLRATEIFNLYAAAVNTEDKRLPVHKEFAGRVTLLSLWGEFLMSHHASLLDVTTSPLSTPILREALVRKYGADTVADVTLLTTTVADITRLAIHRYRPLRGKLDPSLFDPDRIRAEVGRLSRIRAAVDALRAGRGLAKTVDIALPPSPTEPSQPAPVAHDTYEALAFEGFEAGSNILGQLIYFGWQVDNVTAAAKFSESKAFRLRYTVEPSRTTAFFLAPVLAWEPSSPVATFSPYRYIRREPNGDLVTTWSRAPYRVTLDVERNVDLTTMTFYTPLTTVVTTAADFYLLQYVPSRAELDGMSEGGVATGSLTAAAMGGAGDPFAWQTPMGLVG